MESRILSQKPCTWSHISFHMLKLAIGLGPGKWLGRKVPTIET